MPMSGSDETVDRQTLINVYFRDAASYWQEIYERDDVKARVHQERLRMALALVDALPLPAETRVLDVGCGAGNATVALAARGFAVDALDAVPEMVAATRRRSLAAGAASRVTSGLGDVHALPFADGTFGLVMALGVLPWLATLNEPLREISRVLRQDGHLVVSIDNRWGLRQLLEPLTSPPLRPLRKAASRVLPGVRRGEPSARSRLTARRELRGAFAATGLEEIRELALGFGPFTVFSREILPKSAGLRLHRRLQHLADQGCPVLRSIGSQQLVLAGKREHAGP